MPYRLLAHTADIGVEATAPSFPELLEQLATGMFASIVEVEPCLTDRETTVFVEAGTVEELVVDLLSELLYRSEVEEVIFCRFQASQPEEGRVVVTAHGVDARALSLDGAPIKAVTYHDLEVTRSGDDWYGRVYFDV